MSHFFPIMQITAANYRNIKFRPEEFQEILLDKVCIKYFRNYILKFVLLISIPFVLLIYYNFIQMLMDDS